MYLNLNLNIIDNSVAYIIILGILYSALFVLIRNNPIQQSSLYVRFNFILNSIFFLILGAEFTFLLTFIVAIFFLFLFVFLCFMPFLNSYFTNKHYLGVEFVFWYWHSVDIVRLFLFLFLFLTKTILYINIDKIMKYSLIKFHIICAWPLFWNEYDRSLTNLSLTALYLSLLAIVIAVVLIFVFNFLNRYKYLYLKKNQSKYNQSKYNQSKYNQSKYKQKMILKRFYSGQPINQEPDDNNVMEKQKQEGKNDILERSFFFSLVFKTMFYMAKKVTLGNEKAGKIVLNKTFEIFAKQTRFGKMFTIFQFIQLWWNYKNEPDLMGTTLFLTKDFFLGKQLTIETQIGEWVVKTGWHLAKEPIQGISTSINWIINKTLYHDAISYKNRFNSIHTNVLKNARIIQRIKNGGQLGGGAEGIDLIDQMNQYENVLIKIKNDCIPISTENYQFLLDRLKETRHEILENGGDVSKLNEHIDTLYQIASGQKGDLLNLPLELKAKYIEDLQLPELIGQKLEGLFSNAIPNFSNVSTSSLNGQINNFSIQENINQYFSFLKTQLLQKAPNVDPNKVEIVTSFWSGLSDTSLMVMTISGVFMSLVALEYFFSNGYMFDFCKTVVVKFAEISFTCSERIWHYTKKACCKIFNKDNVVEDIDIQNIKDIQDIKDIQNIEDIQDKIQGIIKDMKDMQNIDKEDMKNIKKASLYQPHLNQDNQPIDEVFFDDKVIVVPTSVSENLRSEAMGDLMFTLFKHLNLKNMEFKEGAMSELVEDLKKMNINLKLDKDDKV